MDIVHNVKLKIVIALSITSDVHYDNSSKSVIVFSFILIFNI